MKGYDISNETFKNKVVNQISNEYGFSFYQDRESLEDYNRYFRTKNNLYYNSRNHF